MWSFACYFVLVICVWPFACHCVLSEHYIMWSLAYPDTDTDTILFSNITTFIYKLRNVYYLQGVPKITQLKELVKIPQIALLLGHPVYTYSFHYLIGIYKPYSHKQFHCWFSITFLMKTYHDRKCTL